jgi:hypothetical protein
MTAHSKRCGPAGRLTENLCERQAKILAALPAGFIASSTHHFPSYWQGRVLPAELGGSWEARAMSDINPRLRKAPGRKRAPVAAKRPIPRVGREEMIDRRDRCLGAIAGHRNESNSNAFFLKARTLLTRHWYPSSWRSRADILRNAEWLVRVGSRSDRGESSSSDRH